MGNATGTKTSGEAAKSGGDGEGEGDVESNNPELEKSPQVSSDVSGKREVSLGTGSGELASPVPSGKVRGTGKSKSKRRIAFRLSSRSSGTKETSLHAEQRGKTQGENASQSGEAFERISHREAEVALSRSASKEKRRRKVFKEKSDSMKAQEPVKLKTLVLSEAEQAEYLKQQTLAESLDLEAPSFEKRSSRPKTSRLSRQRSATLGSLPKPKFSPDALFAVKLNKVKPPKEGLDDVSRESARAAKLQFTSSKKAARVLPYLFVSGDYVAKNKPILVENKITHVINAARAVCKDYFPEDYTYLTFNLIDSAKETGVLPFILEAIDFIEQARKEKGVVFVHCHQGVSRSCTIVIAYLMWLNRISFQAAFDMVKEAHPICGPNANFISQLMDWEMTLNLGQYKEPQLFRIAPHSQRDRKLIMKSCSGDKPSIESLDRRGVFLLFDPKPNRLYIWKGGACEEPNLHVEKAEKFSALMRAYIPGYKDCAIIHTENGSVEEQRLFGLLGAKMTGKDVPGIRATYDVEYSKQQETQQQSKQHRPAVKMDAARKPEVVSVKLFLWLSDSNGWEEISSYDGDDLESKNLNVVVSSNPSQKYKCFVWFGVDLENTISEESATKLAREFCGTLTGEGGEAEIQFEKEGEETEEFWSVFEAGF